MVVLTIGTTVVEMFTVLWPLTASGTAAYATNLPAQEIFIFSIPAGELDVVPELVLHRENNSLEISRGVGILIHSSSGLILRLVFLLRL